MELSHIIHLYLDLNENNDLYDRSLKQHGSTDFPSITYPPPPYKGSSCYQDILGLGNLRSQEILSLVLVLETNNFFL